MIRTLVAVAVFVASASAFVPVVKVAARSSALNISPKVFEGEASKSLPFAPQPPNLTGELVGDVGFDPLRFSDRGDVARLREAELKHGRVVCAICGMA
jgi:hypothetical protein